MQILCLLFILFIISFLRLMLLPLSSLFKCIFGRIRVGGPLRTAVWGVLRGFVRVRVISLILDARMVWSFSVGWLCSLLRLVSLFLPVIMLLSTLMMLVSLLLLYYFYWNWSVIITEVNGINKILLVLCYCVSVLYIRVCNSVKSNISGKYGIKQRKRQ